MMHPQGTVTHAFECKCFSWKPIFAGALVAIGLTFLLNLFSVAIGLTAFTTTSSGVETLAFGGLVATALGIIVSMFAAGWLTGYLGIRHCAKRHLGALYGFLAWCVALIITVFLATYIQNYINVYTHFISGTTANITMTTPAAQMTMPVKANEIVISTYIVFCLFFLSAFAASLGGHAGMRYKCKEDMTC